MVRDLRKLREEANEATASGKYKRALAAYLELEHMEPRDAQWSKRAAETYRRLGKDKDAIEAYARAADRYAQNGFLVQAIAVCKLILQIDPKNDGALRRIAAMNEQIGAGPSRAVVVAEHNPALAENAAVAALRRAPTTTPPPDGVRRSRTTSGSPVAPRTITPQQLQRARTASSSPPINVARTKSKPVTLPPGQGIDSVNLKNEVPNAFEREESSGVFVIPIDEEDFESTRPSIPVIEVEPPASDSLDLTPMNIDDATELELADIEEIPLPEPRMMHAAAAATLAATPLFAGLSHEALEALVSQLQLVQLATSDVLFREGDPSDALYVVVEGEVSVQAEGPPRVEMARLGPGAFIGEVALMTDQPRSATVTALGDAELLRIDRPTLSSVLASHGEVLAAVLRFVRERLVDRWTRTSPLFRPFGDEDRALLASRFKFLEVQTGSILLAANQRPDGLYIVLAGAFAVRRNGQQLAMLGPGELIGETALLANGVFRSEVVARGKSLALCLPAADFRELIMTHPHVLEYIGEQAEHSRKLQIL
ncbi:MAG TPA: cyclic nucleotide-binding domain-containing protein [Kofleriaceae bacterium]|nr:cyclic nucleotide-binding domain-containing protein [Kofleriaceae bacterium]